MIISISVLLLVGEISHAQSIPNDTSHSIKFQLSAGGGFMYENLGGILGAQVSYDHFVIASRISSMMSDNRVFAPFETRYFPAEGITDYALMSGYGFFGGNVFGANAFAEVLVGPSYSFGTIRGAFDSASVTNGILPFSKDTTALYYQRDDFRNFGFTIEGRVGLGDDNFGAGISLFLTRCPALLYGGILIDFVFGILR